MELSYRLKTVASMVSPSRAAADVGCDHAYISIYLVNHNISQKVIAMDVNEGPLNIAKNNILAKGLENKIETRLSDGLEKLSPGEVDTIIIAGMGGNLTCNILTQGNDKLHKVNELILQPQSQVNKVRKLIGKLGFTIEAEKALFDEGKYYVVIRAVRAEGLEDTFSDKKFKNLRNISLEEIKETHYLYGRYLLENKDPILHEYLLNKKQVTINIMEKLKTTGTDNARKRLKEIYKQIKYINIALEYY